MNKLDKKETNTTIIDAIRSKRDNRSANAEEIARIEAALIADIEAFDLDAAERNARRQQMRQSSADTQSTRIVFPKILPAGQAFHHKPQAVAPTAVNSSSTSTQPEISLLDQLRQQAASRQKE